MLSLLSDHTNNLTGARWHWRPRHRPPWRGLLCKTLNCCAAAASTPLCLQMPRYPLSGTVGQHRALLTRTSLLSNHEPPNPYLTANWSLQPQYPPYGRESRSSKRLKSSTSCSSASSTSSSSRSSRGRSLCTVLPLSPEVPKPAAKAGLLFQALPNDVVANICFSGYFDTVFVHSSIMLVCKRMPHVAQSSYHALDLRGLSLSANQLSKLSNTYRNLEMLDLRFCKFVDDVAVKRLLPLHATLTHLNLRGCPVTDKGLEAIANFTRIQVLDLSRSTVDQTTMITDAGIESLKSLRDLKTIGLAWNKHITDESIATLANASRSIKRINLQCCTSLSDLSCQYLSSHPLERLDLTGCTFITDQGLRLISGVTTLTSLCVAHCYFLTDCAVDTLLNMANLLKLDMRDCLLLSASARERVLRKYPSADVSVS